MSVDNTCEYHSDSWGTMVMPFYHATNKLQVVGRHTFLRSDQPNGVHLVTCEGTKVAFANRGSNRVLA